MTHVDLQQLVNALDAASRQDLEGTAQRCIARGGNRILVEDLLLALLERSQGLLARALQDAGVEAAQLIPFLHPPIEQGSSCNPVFSPELVQWLQDALLTGTLELGQQHIDQAALVLSLLRNPLRYAGSGYQPLLARIDADRLRDFALGEQTAPSAPQSGPQSESLLERFTHNLTEQARDGKIDPVLCRDDSIRQMVDILSRRRKNNPIVVGDAGVGKTAIVEGLALKIVKGDVPASLLGVELMSLDMGLLQAGASIKGEFERRLKGVIDEVRTFARPIVLFIDEAHMLVGSGGQAGGSDAANLLKPALARGELRTIAATTWSEYKKYVEKDPALSRRFQPVRVLEPTVEQAITILRGLAPLYEKSHGIYLRDDAVVAAARLSARYLTGRQLPDKAVDLLDTACARVRISLAAVPGPLEALRAESVEGQRQRAAMTRDALAGLPIDHQVLNTLTLRLQHIAAQAEAMESRWEEQRAWAGRLLEVRQQLSACKASVCHPDDLDLSGPQKVELEAELAGLQRTLADVLPGERLVSFEVCPVMIAEVVSTWTGVPRSQLAQEYSATVATFARDLKLRIRGQDHAVHALDRAMRAVGAGLNKPDAPVGVFLLVGPSGVGKTETAIALADLLYGGERFLTTINMSEFQEKHTVSRLIGSPPGYIGYGEGGMLTEAVRQKPYSVVLLDEVEKADPDVLNLFYQIFDKGVVNDGEGREIDFRNTLILMTSNLGSEQISSRCHAAARPDCESLLADITPLLNAHFKPALLARMRVVPYYSIDDAVLRQLIDIKLSRLGERLHNRGVVFSHSPALVSHLLERCLSGDSGARAIDRVLEACVTPFVADCLLGAMERCEPVRQVHVALDDNDCILCECA